MVNKLYWKKHIDDFVKIVQAENNISTIEQFGQKFQIMPDVFSPSYSSDTEWFAEKLIPYFSGKNFLEIGTGSGIIACIAKMYGASKVVATDINKEAIKNITLNAKNHALEVDIRFGSIFHPILDDERFDVIFWNHPFYFLEDEIFENENLANAVYDSKYRYLEMYLREGRRFLSKTGKLLLGTSNVARIRLIKKICRVSGQRLTLIHKRLVPVYKEKKVKMDVRLYEVGI